MEEEKLIKKVYTLKDCSRREKRGMRWEFNANFREYHYTVSGEVSWWELMDEIDCRVDDGVLLQSQSEYADRRLNITNSWHEETSVLQIELLT